MSEQLSIDSEIDDDELEPKYAKLVGDLKQELKKTGKLGPAASVLGMRILDKEDIGIIVEGFTGGMPCNIPIAFHPVIKECLTKLGYNNVDVRNDHYARELPIYPPSRKKEPSKIPDYFGVEFNESTGRRHNPNASAMDK